MKSPVVNVPDWQEGNLRQIGNKPGTIGHPLPGVCVRIVDPEDFTKELPVGKQGMMLVGPKNPRYSSVMTGYLNYDGSQPFRDIDGVRWYVSGDNRSLER